MRKLCVMKIKLEDGKEVEACRWFKNGDHPDDYANDAQERESGDHARTKDREGQVVRRFRHPEISGQAACTCGSPMHDHGWIDQGQDSVIVCPGYLIYHENGQYHATDPDDCQIIEPDAPENGVCQIQQETHFARDLEALIGRYRSEYTLTVLQVLGALEAQKFMLLKEATE